MESKLAEHVREADAAARRAAAAFPDSVTKDELPWRVIEAYDASVRGHLERDPRIEDERDRVLITSVNLAELDPDDDEAITAARRHLAEAIGGLTETVLRFGIVNRRAAQQGLGTAGQRVASAR